MQQSSGRRNDWSGEKLRGAERGFTGGEVLMVISLLAFASAGAMTLMKHVRKGKPNQEQLAYQQLILQGRETVDRMVQEVAQTGTPPQQFEGEATGITSANSNRVAASQFLVATATHLIFEADIDRDGAVERVEYRLNGETLERSAVSKFPDGGAPEPVYETLVSNVDNGALPLFSYVGDPFGPPTAEQDSGAVRILLLLRATSKPNKQPYQTVGFEGIAHRQSVVAERQGQTLEQSSLPPSDGAVSELPADFTPIQETYAKKWTLR